MADMFEEEIKKLEFLVGHNSTTLAKLMKKTNSFTEFE